MLFTMKAVAFDYLRAAAPEEITEKLAEFGDEARVLAGGQSLVPMMAMRLLRPAWLVDITKVADLQHCALDAQSLTVAAGVRQNRIAGDAEIRRALPLLAKALAWVGHVQTRNRGTLCGSFAHADPAAELPLVAVTLGATLYARGPCGERALAAADFFQDEMQTALADDEWLHRAVLPVGRGRQGCGFAEINQRQSDFAIAAAATRIELDETGRVTRAAIGIGGCAPAPLRCAAAEEMLNGSRADDEAIGAACAEIAPVLDPSSDLQADAAYRRRVAPELARRALREAREEALRSTP